MNLPNPLKEAYRKQATGQCPVSSDEQKAYDDLANIFSNMEMVNTWIEMLTEATPSKKRKKRNCDLEAFRTQLAEVKQEWQEYAKETVRVLGSVGKSPA